MFLPLLGRSWAAGGNRLLSHLSLSASRSPPLASSRRSFCSSRVGASAGGDAALAAMTDWPSTLQRMKTACLAEVAPDEEDMASYESLARKYVAPMHAIEKQCLMHISQLRGAALAELLSLRCYKEWIDISPLFMRAVETRLFVLMPSIAATQLSSVLHSLAVLADDDILPSASLLQAAVARVLELEAELSHSDLARTLFALADFADIHAPTAEQLGRLHARALELGPHFEAQSAAWSLKGFGAFASTFAPSRELLALFDLRVRSDMYELDNPEDAVAALTAMSQLKPYLPTKDFLRATEEFTLDNLKLFLPEDLQRSIEAWKVWTDYCLPSKNYIYTLENHICSLNPDSDDESVDVADGYEAPTSSSYYKQPYQRLLDLEPSDSDSDSDSDSYDMDVTEKSPAERSQSTPSKDRRIELNEDDDDDDDDDGEDDDEEEEKPQKNQHTKSKAYGKYAMPRR